MYISDNDHKTYAWFVLDEQNKMNLPIINQWNNKNILAWAKT